MSANTRCALLRMFIPSSSLTRRQRHDRRKRGVLERIIDVDRRNLEGIRSAAAVRAVHLDAAKKKAAAAEQPTKKQEKRIRPRYI